MRKTISCAIAIAPLLFGCGQPTETKPVKSLETSGDVSVATHSQPLSDRDVDGTVFIATKGGENVMLGAVTVHLVEWKDVAEQMERSRAVCAQLAEERRNAVLAALEESIAPLEEYVAALKALQNAETSTQGVEAVSRARVLAPFVAREEGARIKADAADTKIALAENSFKRMEKWAQTGERAFDLSAPAGVIRTAVTDSTGAFKIRVPNDRQVGLVAVAKRAIGSSEERYTWCVTLRPNEKGSVHFSNANLLNKYKETQFLRPPARSAPEGVAGRFSPSEGPSLVFGTPTWRVVEKNSIWWKIAYQFSVRNNSSGRLVEYVKVQIMDGSNFELDHKLEKVLLAPGESSSVSGSTLVRVPQASTAKSVKVSANR